MLVGQEFVCFCSYSVFVLSVSVTDQNAEIPGSQTISRQAGCCGPEAGDGNTRLLGALGGKQRPGYVKPDGLRVLNDGGPPQNSITQFISRPHISRHIHSSPFAKTILTCVPLEDFSVTTFTAEVDGPAPLIYYLASVNYYLRLRDPAGQISAIKGTLLPFQKVGATPRT
jgi:hypothetical protein